MEEEEEGSEGRGSRGRRGVGSEVGGLSALAERGLAREGNGALQPLIVFFFSFFSLPQPAFSFSSWINADAKVLH